MQSYFNKKENQFSPASEIQGNDKVKVLGIVWDTKGDHLVFSFENLIKSFNNIIPTKRSILSLTAKFYDPIGLIQPIIIKLKKLLFQEVCVTHADWDIEISEQLKDKFDFIVKFVKTLTAVKVSRCYFYYIIPRDYIVTYELHGFSDASEKAYGCCLHLKCVTKNNFISTSLVASKSRVATYKNKITIPRLELLGNLILSRLILTVLNSFKGETDISSLYAWSDSKVSLAWIKSYNKEFVTFVQNQVVEIRKNVPSEKWNFCSTKLNPADLITRLEKNINLTKNSLWWRGPHFLFEENQNYCKIDDCENKETFPVTLNI